MFSTLGNALKNGDKNSLDFRMNKIIKKKINTHKSDFTGNRILKDQSEKIC